MSSETTQWSLARILDAARRLWFVVVTMVVVAGVGAYALAAGRAPSYEATSTLAFSAGQGSTSQELADGNTYMQTQMPTYAQLATSSAVLQPVIADLGLPLTVQALKDATVVTIPQHTFVLQIQVSSGSADSAAALANGIAQSLTTVIRNVAAKPARGQKSSINVSLVDRAEPPARQASPDKARDAVLGALSGLVIGVLIALMWALLDTRIRDERALRRASRAPVLGTVSRTDLSGKLWVAKDPEGRTAEEFRRICSALAHATVTDQARSILVCSAAAKEGRSVFAANIALTLARLGRNVLLVDADLRNPQIAHTFDLGNDVGLSSVLMGHTNVSTAVQSAAPDLDVLTSGQIPPSPAEALTSMRMHMLLDASATRYDFVIIDSPPVLDVADANLLVPMMDGAVVIADVKYTRRPALSATLANLEGAGGRVLGVALNRARPGRAAGDYDFEAGQEAAPAARRLE